MEILNDERVYERLHAYDFTSDANFVSGWTQLRSGLMATETDLAHKFLEAKVFYYSRFKEEVSLKGYMAWLLKQGDDNACDNSKMLDVNNDDQTTRPVPAKQLQSVTDAKAESGYDVSQQTTQLGDLRLDDQDEAKNVQINSEDLVKLEESADNADSPRYPTSFHELLEKLEKGETLPDIEDLDIRPTNVSVTKSSHDRIPKPWEESEEG